MMPCCFLLLLTLLIALTPCEVSTFQHHSAFHRYGSRALSSTPPSIEVPHSPPPSVLKQRLGNDMKEAMRNKEKARLSAIRAVQSAIKQKEVDDRIDAK